MQHATLRWLREKIAAGEFEPGSQLRQEVLARDLGVSVPPVREALQTLEAEGQVVYAPRRGYFLARLSADELVETYRIRELLETEAVTRSVPTLGRNDLTRMREAIREMERAGRNADVATLTAANRRFHFTLFDAAGMPRMAEMIRVLWDSTDRYRSVYFASTEHRRRVNAEHRAIMSALTARDATEAARLLREHRDHARDALCAALPGDTTGTPPSDQPAASAADSG